MINICIPTYNRLPYLKRCLSSIFDGFENEEYPYEVIVADGGSTDGTLEYLRGLDNKNVRFIEQGELVGVTKSYNTCFKIAKGDYIFGGNDDTVLLPEIMIKACKLMDTEKRIGLVNLKVQEPRHGNLTGLSLNIKRTMTLLGYFHIFRASVLKNEMNYFDESFRSYRTDDDSALSVLKLGYTIISTKDVGLIHYRVKDENLNKARSINKDILKSNQEADYFEKKWGSLFLKIEQYIRARSLKKYKILFFRRVCAKIYYGKILSSFVGMGLYDFLLKQIVIFKDKNYDHLKDFFLAQKYPDEILCKIMEKEL